MCPVQDDELSSNANVGKRITCSSSSIGDARHAPSREKQKIAARLDVRERRREAAIPVMLVM
jgi:hypothetical protein